MVCSLTYRWSENEARDAAHREVSPPNDRVHGEAEVPSTTHRVIGGHIVKLRNKANCPGCFNLWMGLMENMLEVQVRRFVTWLCSSGLGLFCGFPACLRRDWEVETARNRRASVRPRPGHVDGTPSALRAGNRRVGGRLEPSSDLSRSGFPANAESLALIPACGRSPG